MSIQKAAEKAIRKFNWGNFGLDAVAEVESHDWSRALAADVVNAVVRESINQASGNMRAVLGK